MDMDMEAALKVYSPSPPFLLYFLKESALLELETHPTKLAAHLPPTSHPSNRSNLQPIPTSTVKVMDIDLSIIVSAYVIIY